MNAKEALNITTNHPSVTTLYNETKSRIKGLAEQGLFELALSTTILQNPHFRTVEYLLQQEAYQISYHNRSTSGHEDTIVISWLPRESPFRFTRD